MLKRANSGNFQNLTIKLNQTNSTKILKDKKKYCQNSVEQIEPRREYSIDKNKFNLLLVDLKSEICEISKNLIDTDRKVDRILNNPKSDRVLMKSTAFEEEQKNEKYMINNNNNRTMSFNELRDSEENNSKKSKLLFFPGRHKKPYSIDFEGDMVKNEIDLINQKYTKYKQTCGKEIERLKGELDSAQKLRKTIPRPYCKALKIEKNTSNKNQKSISKTQNNSYTHGSTITNSSDIKRLTIQIEKLTKIINDKEKSQTASDYEKNELILLNKKLMNQMSKLTNSKQKCEIEIQQLKNEIVVLNSKLMNPDKNKIKYYQTQIEILKQNNIELNDKLGKLNKNCEEKNKLNAELGVKNNELLNELNSQKQSIEKLNEKISKISNEFVDLDENTNQKNLQIDELKRKVEKYSEELEKNNEEIGGLKREIAKKSSEIAQQSKLYKELSEENLKIQKENLEKEKDLEKSIEKLTKEKIEQLTQLEKLTNENKSSVSKLHTQIESNQQLLSQIEELNQYIVTLTEKKEKTKKEKNEEQVKNLREENQKLQEENKEKEEEINELKEKISELTLSASLKTDDEFKEMFYTTFENFKPSKKYQEESFLQMQKYLFGDEIFKSETEDGKQRVLGKNFK